ncbi:MAG TPA: DUF72 domain-containing protein [Flavobacterium sp.]|jgi:uncharacterized protein YecE (DUF72 family)
MDERLKKINIGTSGWHYKHWQGNFYPAGLKTAEHFEYYLKHFDTVEINNSFYRLPTKETFRSWRENSPADFIYVVKANRFITHMKKLKEPAESIARFMDHVTELKEKLGPILFQLPPGWNINIERFEEFLAKLPKQYRYAFEFRNGTWYDKTIYDLLIQYNCAFCIYELAGHTTPVITTANFVYLRLHGPGDNKYQGSYSNEALQDWAKQCVEWSRDKEVFVYFDNDEAGYAAFNALKLRELVAEATSTLIL